MRRLFRKILSKLNQTLKFSSDSVNSMKVSDFTSLDKQITKSIFRHLLFEETLNVNKKKGGGILEVGVGTGQGLCFFLKLQEYYQDTRQIYAFDSFQGFPKGSKYDSQNFNLHGKPKYRFFSYTFVKEFLLATGASNDQINSIRFIQGYIPESLKKFDNTPITLLNLDLDLYQPTIDSLNYFWKYVLPGGVILLDDYDGKAIEKWPGVKKAVDEFCENEGISVMRGYGNLAYLRKI